MRSKLQLSLIALTALALPAAAQAQGTFRGAQEGAEAGAHAAGPVGAIVGGTVGAAVGTVGGILGIDDRPRFREYVVREHVPSVVVEQPVRVGTVLPPTVTYYEVPAEYHVAPSYRYTVVNHQPVIVEARSRRIVQVID